MKLKEYIPYILFKKDLFSEKEYFLKHINTNIHTHTSIHTHTYTVFNLGSDSREGNMLFWVLILELLKHIP